MLYDDKQELMQEIALGEDTFLEFKEVLFKGNQVRFAREEGKASKVIAEVFISLANTEGGVVLFGVDDQGEPRGIAIEKKDILEQFVVNCSQNNCEPPIDPRLDWIFLPDQKGKNRLCLKIYIPKSRFDMHQTNDGRFLKRVGSHRAPIRGDQLGRLLTSRNLSSPFEERPVYKAELETLDQRRFSDYYRIRFKNDLNTSGLPLERLLGNLKLAIQTENGIWKPTNLGLLLFSAHPDEHLNGAYVEVAVYDHENADGNTRDSRIITGSIPFQIESVLRYLDASPYLATRSVKDGWGRIDIPSYNEFVLQEAIVNAIVHRDYALTGSQIILTLFPDRIEIRNPGGLYNTLTPENLFTGCQPVRRNQLLAGFLRHFHSPITRRSYMEGRGEGFLKMVRESERISGRKPELIATPHAIKLTLFGAFSAAATEAPQ